jgi:hypothetical protein
MTLYGITEDQRKLLDTMWNIETEEELASWIRSLPALLVKEVMVLREMLILSMIDEELEETNDTSLALKMIEKCR